MHLQIVSLPHADTCQLQVCDQQRVLLVSAPVGRVDALVLATSLRAQARTGELSVSHGAVPGGHEARLRDHSGAVVLRSVDPTTAEQADLDARRALDSLARLPLRRAA